MKSFSHAIFPFFCEESYNCTERRNHDETKDEAWNWFIFFFYITQLPYTYIDLYRTLILLDSIKRDPLR